MEVVGCGGVGQAHEENRHPCGLPTLENSANLDLQKVRAGFGRCVGVGQAQEKCHPYKTLVDRNLYKNRVGFGGCIGVGRAQEENRHPCRLPMLEGSANRNLLKVRVEIGGCVGVRKA